MSGGHIYRPQRSCGQGNIFTPVCHSVHRGGVCLSACWDTTPPREQTPPWSRHPPRADTPSRSRHAPEQTPPEQTPPRSRHPRSRHPLEQTPPRADTLPPRSRHTPPPGSRLRHTIDERPVRILLECILVQLKNYHSTFYIQIWRI